MIRRPPRSTPLYSSAASDVYKRQGRARRRRRETSSGRWRERGRSAEWSRRSPSISAVSYTHLRAHETKANLVCRLLLGAHETKANLVCRLLLGAKETKANLVCRLLLETKK